MTFLFDVCKKSICFYNNAFSTFITGEYHLKNKDNHYVIVLQHQSIIVQTPQPNTPPCK